MKKYLPVTGAKKENTSIKVTLDYDLGGYNYFTNTNKPRGYYVTAVPVVTENRGTYTMESFEAYSGVRECVKTVTRRSKKAEAEAEKIAERKLPELLDYLCDKHGFTLA